MAVVFVVLSSSVLMCCPAESIGAVLNLFWRPCTPESAFASEVARGKPKQFRNQRNFFLKSVLGFHVGLHVQKLENRIMMCQWRVTQPAEPLECGASATEPAPAGIRVARAAHFVGDEP